MRFSCSPFILAFLTWNLQVNGVIITNRSQSDGFGSQYQQIIWTAIYAELTNKMFVYTPFKNMEHNYENDVNYIERKEWLINIKNHFPLNNPQYEGRVMPVSGMDFFYQHIDTCSKSKVLQKFKELFRQNKNRDQYFDNSHLNIAIHIRRPNLHDNRVEGTDIPDGVFAEIINKLRKSHFSNEKPPVFHIYSQGNIENFKRIYAADDIFLHIDESTEDTFIQLVFADVLVMSPSAFSYAAALISDGIVYYIPSWQKPLSQWIIINLQELGQ